MPPEWKQLSNSTPTAFAAVFHLRMPPPCPISLRGDTHTVPLEALLLVHAN